MQLEAADARDEQAEDEQHERLRTLLEEAVTFYRHQLCCKPRPGKPALAYLHKRGLTPATIETFGLGYAPDAWDAALQLLHQPRAIPAG